MILITKKIDGLRAVEMFTQTDTSSISRGDKPLSRRLSKRYFRNGPWLHERWGFPYKINCSVYPPGPAGPQRKIGWIFDGRLLFITRMPWSTEPALWILGTHSGEGLEEIVSR